MANDTNVLGQTGTFRVQTDETEYRLVGPNGEEGETVEYGQPAALVIGNAVYYSIVEDPEVSAPVYRVDSVTLVESETQEVEFQYSDDEDEDEEGEDDEEEEGDEDDDADEAEDEIEVDDSGSDKEFEDGEEDLIEEVTEPGEEPEAEPES